MADFFEQFADDFQLCPWPTPDRRIARNKETEFEGYNSHVVSCAGIPNWDVPGVESLGKVSGDTFRPSPGARCTSPPGIILKLRQELQKVSWLSAERAHAVWPMLAHAPQSGLHDFGGFESGVELHRATALSAIDLEQASRLVAPGAPVVIDLSRRPAGARVPRLVTVVDAIRLVRELPSLQHVFGGFNLLSSHPVLSILPGCHHMETCGMEHELIVSPGDHLHADDQIWWTHFYERILIPSAAAEAGIQRWSSIESLVEHLRRHTRTAKWQEQHEQQEEGEEDVDARDNFDDVPRPRLGGSIELCFDVNNPCLCPTTACHWADPPHMDTDEPRAETDIRLTTVFVGPDNVDLSLSTPLPATMAFATALTTLGGVGVVDWAHPQSQAVLRSLSLRSLVVPSVVRAGVLRAPTSGDCHGGSGPWLPHPQAPPVIHRACSELAAVASSPLGRAPLARSLRSLRIEPGTADPSYPYLFGMRPPRKDLVRLVRFIRQSRLDREGIASDDPGSDYTQEPSEWDDLQALEEEEAVDEELQLAGRRLAQRLNLTAREIDFAGRPFLELAGLFPQLLHLPGHQKYPRDEESRALGLERFWHEEALRASPAPAATALVKVMENLFLWPEELRWVCELPHLVSISITATATGLPPCLAKITPLVELDVRGGMFGVLQPHASSSSAHQRLPVPKELRSLRNLRLFVAFQHNTVQCGPSTCRPILEELEALPTKGISIQIGGGWLCPEGGSWSVRLDDRSQAWWGWNRLEKFWVDGNNFTGRIPTWIAHDWPNMITLDLYSNQLTGPIPAEIRNLKGLMQLQLQHNNLQGGPTHERGSDDDQAFFSRALQPDSNYFDLRLNPELSGRVWSPSRRSLGAWNSLDVPSDSPAVCVDGTNITGRG